MQFLKYTVLRLVLFFAVFIALAWGLRFNIWLAAALAAIIAFCISYLFFNRLRAETVAEVQARLAKSKSNPGHKSHVEIEDEEAEDRYQ